jgi:hypothetical protein
MRACTWVGLIFGGLRCLPSSGVDRRSERQQKAHTEHSGERST